MQREQIATAEDPHAFRWARVVPASIVATVLGCMGMILVERYTGYSPKASGLLSLLMAAALLAGVAIRHGRARWGRLLFAGTYLAATLASVWLFGGVRTVAPLSVLPALMVLGMTAGRAGLVAGATFSAGFCALAGLAELQGWLPDRAAPDLVVMSAATVVANIGLLAVVLLLAEGVVRRSLDQEAAARQAARTAHLLDPATGTLSLAGLRGVLDELLHHPDERGGPGFLLLGIDSTHVLAQGLEPAAGESLMRVLASRVACVLRADDAVGRIGSWELGVVLRARGSDAGMTVLARRLCAVVDGGVELDGADFHVRTRVGAVPIGGRHHSADAVLRDANAALAEATGEPGRRIRVFEEGMTVRARQTLAQDRLIAQALEQGWLEPFFQPIVRLDNGVLEGFEALVRCRTPDGQLMAPGDFLPRAEQTGAIVEIDRLVLRRSCEQLVSWDASWPSSRPWVSVNLSAAQFQAPGLVEFVKATLHATGLEPQRLHLELTETALTIDVERTRELLGQLKALGVTLLLDDFGTGWSSLAYVQHYPLDIVKIDRSFTRAIDADGGEELVATIIFMAKQLGLGLVAEGIETRVQYRRLREMGVGLGQGFHFSKPLPADEAERYLRPWIPDEPSRAWDRSMLSQLAARKA